MELDHDTCYRALLAHDRRFDGVFYVGVSTTGVYCRTVCTAKRPRRGNCTFFKSAAAAERAGYRPCLRCRPELAPGAAPVDSTGRLAVIAACRIQEGAHTDGGVSDLAAELGISDRHLRRIVRSAFGVSPVEMIQTERLLMAKRLLTDTELPITEIAFASGFNSLRRFNALFRERYRLTPSVLRAPHSSACADTLICELAYRPPLDWGALLAFLERRTTPGMEWVDGSSYRRTAAVNGHSGWVSVTHPRGRSSLRVELSASLARAILQVLARIRRLFDLHADPSPIAEHLGSLAADCPGLRVPGAFDGFEVAVRAILGQQVSVKSASTLAGRFVQALGQRIDTPFDRLTHTSPTPQRIATCSPGEIAGLGIVQSRAKAIVSMARATEAGRVVLTPNTDPERAIARLRELPGIGEWTAQYIAMRALAWPDAFPHTDLGILKALGERYPTAVLARAEEWRPWRSYAAMHLWKSLETKHDALLHSSR